MRYLVDFFRCLRPKENAKEEQELILKDPSILKKDEFQHYANNDVFMFESAKSNINCLQYATETLRSDAEKMKQLLYHHKLSGLCYVDDSLKVDPKFMLWAVSKYNDYTVYHHPLHYANKILLNNADFMKDAIYYSRKSIDFIPADKKEDLDFMSILISRDSCSIKLVDDKLYKNPDFLSTIVDHKPFVLRHVPQEFISEKLCIQAVLKDARVLQYVPQELLTREFYQQLFSYRDFHSNKVPKSCMTKEFFAVAVPRGFKIPTELRNAELYKYLLDQKLISLYGVHSNFRTEIICEEAVLSDPKDLEHVPEKFRSERLCIQAVLKDATVLQYVPQELLTREFYQQLFSDRDFDFNKVTQSCMTKEFFAVAVPRGFEIPKKLQNAVLYRYLIEKEVLRIDEVPNCFLFSVNKSQQEEDATITNLSATRLVVAPKDRDVMSL